MIFCGLPVPHGKLDCNITQPRAYFDGGVSYNNLHIPLLLRYTFTFSIHIKIHCQHYHFIMWKENNVMMIKLFKENCNMGFEIWYKLILVIHYSSNRNKCQSNFVIMQFLTFFVRPYKILSLPMSLCHFRNCLIKTCNIISHLMI